MATSRTLFERLAMATLVATFILMMLGGYVKAIHAGLACPDWPMCYGSWFPFGDNVPTDGQAASQYEAFGTHRVAAEWIHRWVAAMVGPMILGLAILSWKLRPIEPRIRFFATAALVLLPIQVGFGGLTVLHLLEPVIVVSHLGFATLIFGALLATTVLAYTSPHRHLATPIRAVVKDARNAAGPRHDGPPHTTLEERP